MSKTTPPLISYEEAKKREIEFLSDWGPYEACLRELGELAKQQAEAHAKADFVFGSNKRPTETEINAQG